MNPEAFIRKIEAAQPDEFQRILINSTPEEEKFLRAYLGEERFRKLHHLAMHKQTRRGMETPSKGNVVVLHGIMGSELTALESGFGEGRALQTGPVWLKPWRLIGGRIRLLKLDDQAENNADPDYRVEATGMLKRWYGEQLLSLMNDGWHVKAFWYDWRKDLNKAADELHVKLIDWFGRDAPAHIVAHSMGGLVSRTFIANYPDHWKSLWDAESKGQKGGRLVMIGTPNRGSYEVPQILTGAQKTLRVLALLDTKNDIDEITKIVNTFYGVYQMMPYHAGAAEPGLDLFDAATFERRVNIPQELLEKARAHHQKLESVVDKDRMIYIAGYNRLTYCGIKKDSDKYLSRVGKWARKGYEVTMEGDGSVPHSLGLLSGVKTFYVEDSHSKLPQNDMVMESMSELLQTGNTFRLLKGTGKRSPDEVRAANKQLAGPQIEAALDRLEDDFDKELDLIQSYISLGKRSIRSANESEMPEMPSVEESAVSDMIIDGFLAGSSLPGEKEEVKKRVPGLRLRVVHADIRDKQFMTADKLPVDAISVGHYQGVKPVYAEFAVDQIVTSGLVGVDMGDGPEYDNGMFKEDQLIITQLTKRGALRGDLGQIFTLPDNRKINAKDKSAADRVVAVAGMGLPGRFGIPELTVLVRELVWTLCIMNKKHLATVLISSGSGNLNYDEAIEGWLRGAAQALTSFPQSHTCLEQITFIEYNAAKAIEIDKAIAEYAKSNLLMVDHHALTAEEKNSLVEDDRNKKINKYRAELEALKQGAGANKRAAGWKRNVHEELEPTRFTISIQGDTFKYGALTREASIPERTVIRDPDLIWEANDIVSRERSEAAQMEAGLLMERMLIPNEFRPHLASNVPLVFMLDNKSAQIHWEMIAQSHTEDTNNFLGLGRSLTRQIRTNFAPPPEPPAANRRLLRVLVVADPAEDAPLQGARDEGIEITQLFQNFNKEQREHAGDNGRQLEIKYLIGPQEATRLNVVKELTLRNYDVLHFAGHCFFDEENPERSGWIFSNGKTLSARELSSIDRVPRFVFSNACESGKTSDKTYKHTAQLAPSFAEAFFHQGVANFVCTAWPVDDVAARRFAAVLYTKLLGLKVSENETGEEEEQDAAGPLPIYKAMRAARLAVSQTPNGRQTWGAYQHYGNPYYRFFAAD